MIRPVKTKEEIRAEINAQIEAYLQSGGAVATFRPGESGRTLNEPLPRTPLVERSSAPQERTSLLSEIQAIEARRNSRYKHRGKGHKSGSRSQKTLLTDDFGEPLRWISE